MSLLRIYDALYTLFATSNKLPTKNDMAEVIKNIGGLENVCHTVYVVSLLDGYDKIPKMEIFTSKKEACCSVIESVKNILDTIDELPKEAEYYYDKIYEMYNKKRIPLLDIILTFNNMFESIDYEIRIDLIKIDID